MARSKKPTGTESGSPAPADPNNPEAGSGEQGATSENGTGAEGGTDADPQLPAPQRFNGDVLDCVAAAATTITGCGENELKNYLASTDYILRNLALHLADNWKKICRTAKLQAEEGKSAKVPLSVAIVINHENLLLMDTRVKTSFSLKYQELSETQEDLRQVTFSLPGETPMDSSGEVDATETA